MKQIIQNSLNILSNIGPDTTTPETLEKGKSAQIGEIREWSGKRYKKQANGKWLEVSKYGLTKEEHQKQSKLNFSSPNYIELQGWEKHSKIAPELSAEEVDLETSDASKLQKESKETLKAKDYVSFTQKGVHRYGKIVSINGDTAEVEYEFSGEDRKESIPLESLSKIDTSAFNPSKESKYDSLLVKLENKLGRSLSDVFETKTKDELKTLLHEDYNLKYSDESIQDVFEMVTKMKEDPELKVNGMTYKQIVN